MFFGFGFKVVAGLLVLSLLPPGEGAAERKWTVATEKAEWRSRYGLSVINFDSHLWVFGGYVGARLNDVYKTPDGASWTEVTSSAAWPARYLFQVVTFNSKMWVVGGLGNAYYNDAWSSTDGVTWTAATTSAAWVPRRGLQSWVLGGNVYVSGGYKAGLPRMNDVYRSSDMVTWTEMTSSAAWAGRDTHIVTSIGSTMILMAGYGGSNTNDAWRSTDGIDWTLATGAAVWTKRSGSVASRLAMDSASVSVLGGSPNSNDVWETDDGLSWTLQTSKAPWPGRAGHQAELLVGTTRSAPAVLGGHSGIFRNDVWILSGLPSPPKGLLPGTVTGSTLTLAWALPPNDGGSNVLEYEIGYSVNSVAHAPVRTGSDALSFTLGTGAGQPPAEAMSPGDVLTNVTVRAINLVNAGAASDAVNATLAVPPSPVTTLTSTGVTSSSVKLSWYAPFNGRSPITHYGVTYSVNGSAPITVLTTTSAPTFEIGRQTSVGAADAVLPPGVNISGIKVVAYNMVGPGVAGNNLTAVTDRTPMPVATVRAGTVTTQTVPITWNAPFDGGQPILDYEIRYTVNNVVTTLRTGSTATNFTIGALQGTPASQPLMIGDIVYPIDVRGINAVGTGPAALVMGNTTTIHPPFAVHRAMVSGALGNGTIPISWSSPHAHELCRVTHYTISYLSRPDSGSLFTSSKEFNTTTPHLSIVLGSGVPAANTYIAPGSQVWHIMPRAWCFLGGAPAGATTFALLPTRPQPVATLSVSAVTTSTIPLTFDVPADMRAPITDFVLVYNQSGVVKTIKLGEWPALGTLQFVIGSGRGSPPSAPLPPGSVVTGIRVAAINLVGEGAVGAVVQATTPLTSAPAAILDLRVYNSTASTLSLTWTPPASGESPLTGYELRYTVAGTPHATVKAIPVSAPPLTLGGGSGAPVTEALAPGSVVTSIDVRASNAVGVAAASNLVAGVTPSLPETPNHMAVTGLNATSFVLEWAPPYNDGSTNLTASPVTSYTVQFLVNAVTYEYTVPASTRSLRIGDPPRTATLVPGTTVSNIRVRATTANGAGPYSPALAAVTPNVPDRVTTMQGFDAGRGMLQLLWDPPADNGAPIIAYEIRYITPSGPQMVRVNAEAQLSGGEFILGQPPHTQPLPFGKTITWIEARAINSVGTAVQGSAIHLVVARRPPSDVQVVNATGATFSSVRVQWMVPLQDGGSPITGYQIRFRWRGIAGPLIFVPGAATTSFDIGSTPDTGPLLSHEGITDIDVRAVNDLGVSLPQQSGPVALARSLPPQPPGKIVATAAPLHPRAVRVTWSPPPANGAELLQYIMQWEVNGAQSGQTLLSGLTPQFDIGSGLGTPKSNPLEPLDRVTYIVVKAVNAAGEGVWSDPVSAVTLPATVPHKPMRLASAVVTYETIELRWEMPTFDGGAVVLDYAVGYNVNDVPHALVRTHSTVPTFTLGSKQGTILSAARRTDHSNDHSTDHSLPAPRDDLAHLRRRLDTQRLAPDGVLRGSEPLLGGSRVTDIVVYAVNRVGLSERSNNLTVITEPPVPPGPVASLGVRNRTRTSVEVHWTAPNVTGGAAVLWYMVQYTVGRNTYYISTQSPTLSFVIGGGGGKPPSMPIPMERYVVQISVWPVTIAGSPRVDFVEAPRIEFAELLPLPPPRPGPCAPEPLALPASLRRRLDRTLHPWGNCRSHRDGDAALAHPAGTVLGARVASRRLPGLLSGVEDLGDSHTKPADDPELVGHRRDGLARRVFGAAGCVLVPGV